MTRVARQSVHFWPHLASADVASTRIRCLQVMQGLQQLGWAASSYRPGADRPLRLVLAKRYDAETLAHALDLRRRHGTRIVLDVCDNHFQAVRADAAQARRADALRRALEAADTVVASSAALAQVLRRECGALRQLVTIDDAIDPLARPGPGGAGWALQRARLAVLQTWQRPAPGRRLVWFGQYGSGYDDAGMADLQRIAAALADHHARAPLLLTVVSNRWRRYRELARGWRFPSGYVPWSAATFAHVLQRHDIALIPLTPNPFTLCKTANRAVTAFAAGLAVACDPMPAYDEMGEAVVVGDWQGGLAALMDDPRQRAARRAVALARMAAHNDRAVIAAQWDALLSALPTAAADPQADMPSATRAEEYS